MAGARRDGLTTVPAVVRVSDDIAAVEEALVENLHREDLTALEEAAAYLQLIEDFQLTHDDVAKHVGKSRSAVTNTLRLLGLPPAVQRLLADGKLSAGHAKALLGTPDRPLQERLAERAVSDGWSVRMMEDVVRNGGELPSRIPDTTTASATTPSPPSGPGESPRRDCDLRACSSSRNCSPPTSTPESACRWAANEARSPSSSLISRTSSASIARLWSDRSLKSRLIGACDLTSTFTQAVDKPVDNGPDRLVSPAWTAPFSAVPRKP